MTNEILHYRYIISVSVYDPNCFHFKVSKTEASGIIFFNVSLWESCMAAVVFIFICVFGENTQKSPNKTTNKKTTRRTEVSK